MGEYYVGEYRGCKIWLLTPPDYTKDVYHSPCVPGFFTLKSALKKRICEATGGQWVDGKCTTPPPIVPPPPDEPHRVEPHRGVSIWYGVVPGKYTATVAGTYPVEEWTYQACTDEIDRLLDWLNPPVDPPDGLFAQVTAAVKAWVLKNMPDWVLEWGKVIKNFITNVDESINYWGDQITQYIDNSTNYWGDVIEKTFVDARKWIDNSITYVDDSITNNITEVHNHITNLIGASTEWVNTRLAENRAWTRDFFKLMDPTSFLKDPLGTIKAAFSLQRKIAEEVVVRSFWEGFEEGLAEEG